MPSSRRPCSMASPPRSPARRCGADTLIDAQPTRPAHPAPWAVTAVAYGYRSCPLAHPSPTTGAHRLTNPSPHYRCPPPRRLRLWCTARCMTPSTCPSSTTGASEAGGSAAARHDSSAREREWRTERAIVRGSARAPSLPARAMSHRVARHGQHVCPAVPDQSLPPFPPDRALLVSKRRFAAEPTLITLSSARRP